MIEQIIHSVLLALHNIALVGCAAAPFYNRNLVLNRGQYGAKLHYELDKVVEDTLQGNAPYCMVFISVLWLTGLGMPMNHYFFHGAMKEISMVSTAFLSVKLVSIIGMMVIMGIIFFQINPELKEIFSKFAANTKPDEKLESRFFSQRKRRKNLCEICLVFAIMVLVSSAFLGFKI